MTNADCLEVVVSTAAVFDGVKFDPAIQASLMSCGRASSAVPPRYRRTTEVPLAAQALRLDKPFVRSAGRARPRFSEAEAEAHHWIDVVAIEVAVSQSAVDL
jgi:hypothetical protein